MARTKKEETKESQETMADLTPEEQALVPANKAEIELAENHAQIPDGFDEWDEGDRIIPRWKIGQPTSKDPNSVAGEFINQLDGRTQKKLRFVALQYRKGCVRWDAGGGNDEPLCKSNDGLIPDSRIENPFSGECFRRVRNRMVPVCPEAKFENGNRPRCSKNYTFVCLDLEDNESPFFITFHGRSLKPCRTLITKMWQARKPLYHRVIEAWAERVTNDFGVFYEVRFAVGEAVDAETLAAYRDAYEQLKAVDLQLSYDAEADGELAEGGGGGGAGADDGYRADMY